MRIKDLFLTLALLNSPALLEAGECCPPGAWIAPNCSCLEAKDIGTLYSAWPNLCSPCPPVGWGETFEVSFLYWQAQEDGLDFAIKNNPTYTPTPTLYANVNGQFIGLDFNWEPALKLNGSMIFPNGWDFDFRWTTYYSRSKHTTSHAAVDANTTSGLYPLWLLPNAYAVTPPVYGQARGLWNLHLNTFDFELGANAFLTPRVSLRFHGGFKCIIIDQKYRVKYLNGITNGANQMLPSRAALSNDCFGAGPRIGFNSRWFVAYGWSIAADIAGSMTLNRFKMKRSDSDRALAPTLNQKTSYFREKYYAFRPNLEALLGASWDTCYGCNNRYSFGFMAAYELQYYWEQNMMPQLVSRPISFLSFPSRGDLHCHGLTATLRFGF